MFKNFSIKVKILAISVLGLSLLAGVIGIVSVNTAKVSLLKKSYDTLTSARDGKTEQIQNFFAERMGDINVLAQSKDVKKLVYDFDKLSMQLNVSENGDFPVEHKLVKETTASSERFFQNYIKEYGYYDIFLINAKTGHVVYTAAKESDYGVNLKKGSLKSSGLGEVWRKTIENRRTTFVDMNPYAPSNGDPAMFIGTPIIENGKVKSVLVFQISDAKINKIMSFRKGYGDTQEDYLVGSDYLMRSDSFLDPKAHSLKASFGNPEMGKAKTKASINAFEGKTNTEIVMDYNANPVLSAYGLVKIGQDFTWAILAEIDEAEVLIAPNELRAKIIVIALVLLIVITFLVYVVISKGVISPLNEFQNGLIDFFKYLNKENKDVKLLDDTSKDEIGIMAKIINKNISKVKCSIEEDTKFLDEVVVVVEEVKKGYMLDRLKNKVSSENLEYLRVNFNEMLISLNNNIGNDINKILSVLENFKKLDFRDEIKNDNGEVCLALNNVAKLITEMLIENKRNGLTLSNSSNVLLENVDTLNRNSNEAAAALEETAAALEEITSNIVNNTDNVVKMSEYAEELNTSAKDGENLANQTTTAMNEIDEQVVAINEAISVIDQIAFQTNILSLNAAVEAATAGEAGKGFAVVAQEVRNLASRSAEAAEEIKELVENATKKADNGKKIAAEMIKGFSGLNNNINKTIELISNVESASKEQQSGIEQINDAITVLDQQTQENAAISNKTRDVADQTDIIAKLIVQSVDEKEFHGKDNVRASSFEDNSQNKKDFEKKEINAKIYEKPVNKKVFKGDDTESWESF